MTIMEKKTKKHLKVENLETFYVQYIYIVYRIRTKKKIMQTENSFERSIVGRLHLRNKKEDVWRLFTPPLECGIVVVDIRITFAVYILY